MFIYKHYNRNNFLGKGKYNVGRVMYNLSSDFICYSLQNSPKKKPRDSL